MVREYVNRHHEANGENRWDVSGNRQLNLPDAFRSGVVSESPLHLKALEALHRIATITATARDQAIASLERVQVEGSGGAWSQIPEQSVAALLLNNELIERHPDDTDSYACTSVGDRFLTMHWRGMMRSSPLKR